MANAISIDNIAQTIVEGLDEYTVEVAKGVKDAVDVTAKELCENIKADAPSRYGKYKKAMALKTSHESDYEKRVTWYVKSPHYRLSHLLENGHIKRGGGRVKAHPHIAKNEEKAMAAFEERVEEVISNAGK